MPFPAVEEAGCASGRGRVLPFGLLRHETIPPAVQSELLHKLIIQPSFFYCSLIRFSPVKMSKHHSLSYCMCFHLSWSLIPVKTKQILYSEKTRGSSWWEYVGSDRRSAVSDLRFELFRRLGQWRLLQHSVLHDHLLVGIDRGVCVIRVVPRLVSACLIGWLWTKRLFALAAQHLAGRSNQMGGQRWFFFFKESVL